MKSRRQRAVKECLGGLDRRCLALGHHPAPGRHRPLCLPEPPGPGERLHPAAVCAGPGAGGRAPAARQCGGLRRGLPRGGQPGCRPVLEVALRRCGECPELQLRRCLAPLRRSAVFWDRGLSCISIVGQWRFSDFREHTFVN